MTEKQTHRCRRRRPSSCHRHPTEKPTTGFCASCLRERLATIESSQCPSSSSSYTTSAAAQLRRTRSHCSRANPAEAIEQPRRRSCDVRAHTLHDLFAVHDGEKWENPTRKSRETDLDPELKEEREEYEDEDENDGNEEDEIKGFDEGKPRKLEAEDFEDEGEHKTMKEFMDLEWGTQSKKNAGRDFRQIASVLSRKLKKWSIYQQKNKKKEDDPDGGSVYNGKIHSRVTETAPSEVAEYNLGRRSCDTDLRFSLDNGRISFEEPRASLDGCLIGKTYPKLTPLASVVENVKANYANNVKKEDEVEEEEKNPGGSAQTRDFYADSRRRRSFDRSSSIKRPELLQLDELNSISNSKVSPQTVGLFHGAKLLVTEKELRDSNWYSIKNHKPESVEYDSKRAVRTSGEVSQGGFVLKKLRSKWPKGWNIWGSTMQKRNETKNEVKVEKSLKLDENLIEGSLAESLLRLRGVAKGEGNGAMSQKHMRSYSGRARNSCDGLFHGGINSFERGRSSCDGLFQGDLNGLEGKESHFLQRNTSMNSSRYCPKNLDNDLLRYYLSPLRSYKTDKSVKSRLKNSSSVTGSVV